MGRVGKRRTDGLVGAEVIRKGGRWFAAYDELEEYHAGMWRRVTAEQERQEWTTRAASLLRDIPEFEAVMRRALCEWPKSCLVAFTNPSLNKPVWLAHAGAALAHGIPEEFMRLGYWELSEDDRVAANDAAERIAREWVQPDQAQRSLFGGT